MSPLDLKRKKDLSKFTAASLGISVGVFFMTQLISQFITGHPDDPSVRWLAVLPVVAMLMVMGVMMRSLRQMDELERKMHTEALGFAFLGSLLLVSTYGFLSVTAFEVPPLYWLVPAMVGCWIIGLLLAVERYR